MRAFRSTVRPDFAVGRLGGGLLTEHAGDRRGDLLSGLLGLQDVDRIALGHLGAVLDEPLGQAAFGHRHHARRVVRYDEVVYRGDDGRYYCHRSDGTTGLIVGAVAGGVIGNQLARGKSAALGTILGAGAGALLGREIGKRSNC